MAVGKWETCFWFSTFPRPCRRSCGNVGISRPLRDFQGAVERGGILLLDFHAFHNSAISTALLPAACENTLYQTGGNRRRRGAFNPQSAKSVERKPQSFSAMCAN